MKKTTMVLFAALAMCSAAFAASPGQPIDPPKFATATAAAKPSIAKIATASTLPFADQIAANSTQAAGAPTFAAARALPHTLALAAEDYSDRNPCHRHTRPILAGASLAAFGSLPTFSSKPTPPRAGMTLDRASMLV